MNLAGFDLNLLIALDALLREQSVTAAAKRLGISQSTMSENLARLRKRLEDPLLVRVGRSLARSPRAEELQPAVRQLLLGVQGIITPATNFDISDIQRCVRIMATEHSMILILPHVFKIASDVAPGLTFEVLAIAAPAEHVIEGAVDLCLTGEPLESIGKSDSELLRTRTVLLERFVAIADRDHPLAGHAISVDELRRYPHVTTHFPGVFGTVEDIVFKGRIDPQSPAIRVPSFIAVGPAVAGSKRIAIVPAMLAPLMTNAWPLRTFELSPEVPASSVRALWHVRNDADHLHRWLRNAVIEVCHDLGRGEFSVDRS